MTSVRRFTDYFSPTHYTLSLAIQREERTFSGTVTIQGTAQHSSSIALHAKDLIISNVTVDDSSRTFTQRGDELEIALPEPSSNAHAVTVQFTGTITDQMHGMYPCYYSVDGVTHELIATQFESHHAREVFPCIDEPEAKATFDVTLVTEAGAEVLANMPVASQVARDDTTATTFDRSPRMSTYLLAWVYGSLHKVSGTSKSGVAVNIWATPAQPASSLHFALDIATRTIDFFDDYFGVAYPLPKSDHVALPDFSSGAMENWGLITYREVALLAEPGAVSVSSKHRIAAVIAHELSHQWFGNLVTMKWWNNLWLNESFANLMEYIAIDALEPQWNVWNDFASYETVMSLRRDAIDGVQSVQVDVQHPDEISTLFDPAIVYAKGSRLLRMLERYIGTDAFKQGLRSYFQQHAYKNTDENDLWAALSEASGKDIAAFMTPWISQPGYPVISVSKTGLSQKQFFIGTHADKDRQWSVPLRATDASLPQLLTEKELTVAVDPRVRLNHDDSAHFITHYSPDMMEHILETVRDNSLDSVGRVQLLNENILLARGEVISSASLIPIIQLFSDETAESVWDLIAVTIGELKKFVQDDDQAEQSLRRLSASLAAPQFERLGWSATEQETEADTKLRATIIGMMLYGEDASVISDAQHLYETGIESVDPELRGLVLSSVVRHATTDTVFTELFNLYSHTTSAELQQDICAGLTSTKNAMQVETVLQALKDTKKIRTQDTARWFVYLVRSRHGRDLAWQWLQDNWSWIETTFGGDKSFDDYPRYAASGLSTAQQLEQYIQFFGPMKSIVALKRVIEMGTSEIEARVALLQRDTESVRAALRNLEG